MSYPLEFVNSCMAGHSGQALFVQTVSVLCKHRQTWSGIILNVPAHPSYTIIATDGDAVDEIS